MRKAILTSLAISAFAGAALGLSSPALAAASCSARMHAVREAWEKMPDSPKKAEIANHYNDANHAQKSHDEQGCLAHIEKAEAAMKSGP